MQASFFYGEWECESCELEWVNLVGANRIRPVNVFVANRIRPVSYPQY